MGCQRLSDHQQPKDDAVASASPPRLVHHLRGRCFPMSSGNGFRPGMALPPEAAGRTSAASAAAVVRQPAGCEGSAAICVSELIAEAGAWRRTHYGKQQLAQLPKNFLNLEGVPYWSFVRR
jgi:hypothetical protein